jgi:hypothetical protein
MELEFLDGLEDGVAELLRITTDAKLDAFDAGAEYLKSPAAQAARAEISTELLRMGYHDSSALLDPQLLADFLSRPALEIVADNRAAIPGGSALLDGELVSIGYDAQVVGAPVGPVLVVGSGNSLVPALVSAVEALLANCPVVLRGSSVNQRALELVVTTLRASGDPVLGALLEHLHLFFADHRTPEGAARLHELLRTGPFGAGVFWGGRAAIDTLVAEFGHNPRHPVPIPMEPLTGVAVVSQEHLDAPDTGPLNMHARAFAEAMVVMGQQLCSSPTEAYFVGGRSEAEAFAAAVAAQLRDITPRHRREAADAYALTLDRLRDRAADLGSLVITPSDGAGHWTLLVSENASVFPDLPADLAVGIHDRFGFVEIVVLPDIESVAEHIRRLPEAPCHGAANKVQTVLRLVTKAQAGELVRALRARRCVYRVVPPEFVARRHPLEPLDGQHLVSLLTRQVVLL